MRADEEARKLIAPAGACDDLDAGGSVANFRDRIVLDANARADSRDKLEWLTERRLSDPPPSWVMLARAPRARG